MKRREKTLFQANEFAKLTGVTVRALHHYDEVGLIKPRRSESGYRLYGEQEFARLQQVVTLKFIGLSLKEIKALLGKKQFDLESTLSIQKRVIESKRRKLDLVAKAIEQAGQALRTEGKPNWNLFKKIVEEIEMENQKDWMKQYYTQEQLDQLAKRWRPEIQEEATKTWQALLQDAELLSNEDPASRKAQDLAGRWEKQIVAFTGGDPGIAESLNKLYQDKANWPEAAKNQWKSSLSKNAEDFINKAREIWKKKNS